MKLSEAIRLGSMATTQGFGCESGASDDAPCALGAARLAIGIKTQCDSVFLALNREWPMLLQTCVADPVTSEIREICGIIWRLNDEQRWSRERIADWVETIERTQEAATHQPEQIGQAQ